MPGRTKQKNEVQTIVIDRLGGPLTNVRSGPMNSGLAYYQYSYGYNPFLYPGSLVWLPAATDVTSGSVTGLILDGTPYNGFIYAITSVGEVVKMNPDGTYVSTIVTISTGTPTFTAGGTILFYNNKFFIGHDKGVTSIATDGTGEAQVGTWDSSHYTQNVYRPLAVFIGTLVVGNTTDGTNTNIGIIDTTNTITNYNRLSPSLGAAATIADLDVANDFSYLTISVGTTAIAAPFIARWNGTDNAATSGIQLPTGSLTAQNNFGDVNSIFMYDAFGAALYEGNQKVLSLFRFLSPTPGATDAFGNILGWGTRSTLNSSPSGNKYSSAIAFYGSTEASVPKGLYWINNKLYNDGAGHTQSVDYVPFFAFTQSAFINNTQNTFLFSVQASGGVATTTKLFSIEVASNPMFGGSNIANDSNSSSYTTQVETFEKKVGVNEVRVYVDSTSSDSGFNLSLIDATGTAITNGTFSWNAATGPTPNQGRILFDPSIVPTFDLGLKLTPNGTNYMVIRKIEVDVVPAGK